VSGVKPGDRIAAVIANVPEAIVGALAAAAIGAVWSSCSPDFGVRGILDRFGQIEPVAIIAVDGYTYGGTRFDILTKLREVLEHLPTVRTTVIVPLLEERPEISILPTSILWRDWLAPHAGADLQFVRMSFNHPLY